MVIKFGIVIGFFSLLINQLSSPTFIKINDFSALIKSYNANFLANDSYFGVIVDVLINLVFNVNIQNISESLKIYGVI